jgi:Recombination endonuclease VII
MGKSLEFTCVRCEVVKPRDQFASYKGKLNNKRLCVDCRKSSRKGVPPLTHKKCPECGIVKARSEYNVKNNNYQTSRPYYEGVKRRYQSLRERCKPCESAWTARATKLRTYGITSDQLDAMLARGCEVCGSMELGKNGLHVDHDHATGVVRGTLCAACNKGIGFFKDDPTLLEKAVQYLRRQDADRLEVSGL